MGAGESLEAVVKVIQRITSLGPYVPAQQEGLVVELQKRSFAINPWGAQRLVEQGCLKLSHQLANDLFLLDEGL
ncbi:hypothetical protein PGT21_014704 [Puccinia graminis f. sp. tritici]|uniref:Uncharacterized protein n=1 Tax=Puccinia graminis f. sp. tritici TaxID=56615 RepID=A0A5B0PDZ8_PUCGR|nr:hypothetical protein PGTUg99_018466 [Puccinia graminis f. sp. tritici]KAA1105660.1 hypothetical protein PGT21_014704 [Puccinia graminis f. sp. tritici]